MKNFWIYIVVILIVAAIFFVYQQETAKAPSQEPNIPAQTNNHPIPPTAVPTANSTPTKSVTPTPSPTGAHYSSGAEGENAGSSIQVYEVDYTDQGFIPAKSNLNVGDYIFFRNKSTTNFLPFDSAYAGLNATAAIAPGKEYKFQFNQAGTWTVQNQLNPAQTTVVVVSK